MCGIAGTRSAADVERLLAAIAHRGPDGHAVARSGPWHLAHARLAIIDPTPASDQPFRGTRGTLLAYNGECWNYKELREELRAAGVAFRTSGDTEVVSAALERWGVEALKRMEWMGALAWSDGGNTLLLARDRFGEVPLYEDGQTFASERKALPGGSRPVPPGHALELPGGASTCWYGVSPCPLPEKLPGAPARVQELVLAGCRERAVSDVPVCALLSGGLDSSAICLGLKPLVKNLVAYAAVHDPKSADLKRAREVAAFLGIELREVPVRAPTDADLREVVRIVETPSKAQAEIGWACLALAERMRADGFKVTFSGEGSDELWASYGFAFHALKTEDWHAYRKRLVLAQAEKNFARCNKVFLSRGVECRLPFLHRPLVELALDLPRAVVQAKGRPKAILQEAFRGLLPDSVVNRQKVAFQDGLGIKRASARVVTREAYDKMYGPQGELF